MKILRNFGQGFKEGFSVKALGYIFGVSVLGTIISTILSGLFFLAIITLI